MLYDDVAVFYREQDFGLRCTRQRVGETDLVFPGMLAVADAAVFDGQVVAGVQQLRFPTAAADLQQEDTVLTQRLLADGAYSAPQTWRVLRTPERVVDGKESLTFLWPQET